MITAPLFIGTLSTFVACSAVLEKAPDQLRLNYSKVSFSQWQQAFCQRYEPEFDLLYFEKIAEANKHHQAIDSVDQGYIKIGAIRSGRVELNWTSASTRTSVTIWLKVIATREVWVFKKNKSPESDIQSEDVQRASVNVAWLIGNKNIEAESPIGKTAIRQIRKGDIFTNGMTAAAPLVKRNDKITVTAGSGSLKITSLGVALETGWVLGEKVLVQVENSIGPVTAKIIGKNNVLVEI